MLKDPDMGLGHRQLAQCVSTGQRSEVRRISRRRFLRLSATWAASALSGLMLPRCAARSEKAQPDEGFGATLSLTPTRSSTLGEGTIGVSPTTVVADSYETLTFDFTVGPSGMDVGGGLSLQFPTRRDRTLPLLWDDCQAESPDKPGYVDAWTDGTGEADVAIECKRKGVLSLVVQGGTLPSASGIHFSYTGNVQALARTLALRVHSRRNEWDPWTEIAILPRIEIVPSQPELLLVVGPANVGMNSPFELAIVALDRFGNRATGYRGIVSFASSDPGGQVPLAYAFTEEDAGVRVFGGVRYGTPGFHRVTVADGVLTGRSNYSHVGTGSLPRHRRCFGDTHFHTGTGAGNVGGVDGCIGDHRANYTTEEEAYAHARDVMRLDFASVSEHDAAGFTDGLWARSQDISESFYQPGVFTTFFAYEWTSWEYGHRVVMYKDYGNETYRSVDENYDNPRRLWAALEEQGKSFITIPHVMDEWTEFDRHPLWVDINNEHQPIGEIYSQHNLINQGGDLIDTPGRFELGIDHTWSYQYAWHAGHKIGLIGSSDNHLGTPGTNDFTPYVGHPTGLAVVLAEGNDRSAIWEAFEARRCYATTGTRIYLDFGIDGHFMGEEFVSNKSPAIAVMAAGTDSLQTVELIKHDESGYTVIHAEQPDGETCCFDYVDWDFKENSYYYVRLRQVDGEMAWSSPIWIAYGSD